MKVVFITLWILSVTAGSAWLWSYELTAGRKGDAPLRWESSPQLVLDGNRHNLVISLHPHCPCSRATVEELSRILAHTGARLKVHALLFAPEDAAPEWFESALVDRLLKLPHTAISTDVAGRHAAARGALTSGDAQLYAPDETLIFHGGVTIARGHAGDSPGSAAVIAAVNNSVPEERAAVKTPVYGCQLHGAKERAP